MSVLKFNPNIYFVQYEGWVLFVRSGVLPVETVHSILDQGGILIWRSHGRYRLITRGILQDIVIRHDIGQSLAVLYPRSRPGKPLTEISWDRGLEISTAIASGLLSGPCDSSDELSDADTATEPASENETNQP